MIKVSYILPTEESAKSSSERTVLMNPFIRRELELPAIMKFSISFGISFRNQNMKDLFLVLLDPDDELISKSDILDLHFSREDLFKEDGSRREGNLAAEITMISDENGIKIEKKGVYKIQLVSDDKVIGDSFFYVVVPSGDKDV